MEWLRNRTIGNFRLDPQLPPVVESGFPSIPSTETASLRLLVYLNDSWRLETLETLETVQIISNQLVDAEQFRVQTTSNHRPPLGGEISLLGEGETEACQLASLLEKVRQYDAV